MRGSRLLVVMLAALALAGCLRHDPPLPGTATQAQANSGAPVYHAQTMPPPASAPMARGLFAQGGPMAQMPLQGNSCGPQGCAATPVVQAPPAPPAYAAYPPQVGAMQGYVLDAGDRLRITVFSQQELTSSFAVDAAGNITIPQVGMVPARGFTTEQLSQSISERLRHGSIREPQVAIEIEAYRPLRPRDTPRISNRWF